MIGFEQAFADTESAAASAVKSAADVAKLARGLEKAAKTGNINAVKKMQSELHSALGALRQEVENATEAWPFQPEDEETYLKEHFATELRQVAASQGLGIYERDERLIAHPSIVRVLPSSRAVRIDRKQVSTIRPRHLVSLLLAEQKKPARFNSRTFLESVYSAYKMRTGNQSSALRLEGSAAPIVPLSAIYDVFTVMPGISREYGRTDFARDLYRLDTGGPSETRTAAQLHFHSGRQSNIAFVSPDGNLITYHNIAFKETRNG